MPIPKDELYQEHVSAWRTYLNALEQAIVRLEVDIGEAAAMADLCTNEWCQATEHVIDDLSNALFSISEPRWSNKEDTELKVKALSKRIAEIRSQLDQSMMTI